jgi:hypothetical protein
MYYAVQEAGREVDVISLKDCFEKHSESRTDRDCVIFRGSINGSSLIKQNRPNWIGTYHSQPTFCCSNYYSYWGKYLTQKNYIMMPVAEVLRKWDWLFKTLGKNNKLFIRPNSGEKEFNGQLISHEMKESWKMMTVCIQNCLINEMCVISSPINIQKEFRLIIADNKVITGSLYKELDFIKSEPLEDQRDKSDIVEFAERIINDDVNSPVYKPPTLPPVYCLDIAFASGEYSILEVGCFCCCGLYLCDIHKIAIEVSETVEKNFKEDNRM